MNKKIVDLSTNTIIIKSELAAKLMCESNPRRFAMPEDVLLTVDMPKDEVQAIKDAIRFNNASELPDAPSVIEKPKPEKTKPVEPEYIEVDFKEEPDFDDMTVKELKEFAEEKGIDISNGRLKRDFVKILSEHEY